MVRHATPRGAWIGDTEFQLLYANLRPAPGASVLDVGCGTGYGIGALLLGWVAHDSGNLASGFWFVAIAMFVSGLIEQLLSEETHPRINPARVQNC